MEWVALLVVGMAGLGGWFAYTKAREVGDLRSVLEAKRTELATSQERVVRLEAEHESLQTRMKDREADFDKLRAQAEDRFKTLAQEILDKSTEKFDTHSKASLESTMKPIQEKLEGFNKLVQDSFGAQAKDQASLKGEINKVVELHTTLGTQTENLTRALEGDSKAQGDWGEVILERVLKASGLREDEDYILQGRGMGLHNDEGKRQKPDVLIRLPEKGKYIIIDAKVSLTHYKNLITGADETSEHTKSHIASIRHHIKNLAGAEYHHNNQILVPDFTLMFIPIESAYALAVGEDPSLYEDAMKQSIVVVYPQTLFLALKLVASLWHTERQNINAQQIAQRGGLLYDKIRGFLEDMDRLGKHLNQVQGSFENSMNKLQRGSGNIVSQTQQLRNLGVKPKKEITIPYDSEGDDDTDSLSPT